MMIFEKMISGSGQNLVSGFLVSGFYSRFVISGTVAAQNTQELLLTPNSLGDIV